MRATLLSCALVCACMLVVPARAAFFSDVPERGVRARVITDAAYHQLMEGYSDGSFRPDAPLTRADGVMVLARLLNTALKGFMVLPGPAGAAFTAADVPAKHWMQPAAAFLRERGMLPASADGRFGPNTPLRRGEFLAALYALQHAGAMIAPAEAATWMAARDLLPEGWAAAVTAPATRAEVAQLLDNLLLYLTQHAETEGTITSLETDDNGLRWVKMDTVIGPCRLALPTRGVAIHGGGQDALHPGVRIHVLSDAVSAVTPYYRVRDVTIL